MRKRTGLPTLVLAAAVLFPVHHVSAEEGEGAYVGKITNEATARECSACHMAYQPAFLSQRSWKAIMENLAEHFGEDASLDNSVRQEIEGYLVANAGDAAQPEKPGTKPPILRITELSWFNRVHGRRARAYAAGHPNIGTISNCTGCHSGAANGFFEGE